MKKTILITGATDGIGLETAKRLVVQGHRVLLHGRSAAKLEQVQTLLCALPGAGPLETYRADLSQLHEVDALARQVRAKHQRLDVLINNAGVFSLAKPRTTEGLDVRFAVNTLAPYLLTQQLLPLLGPSGRVINLSSAAQAPVDPIALAGRAQLPDNQAYAQSKLALTIWSRQLGLELRETGPMVVAVNPGSLLGSKMVKDAYGIEGGDLSIGAEILQRAALSDEFAEACGDYYDNDAGRFAPPHPDALDPQKIAQVMTAIDTILAGLMEPKS